MIKKRGFVILFAVTLSAIILAITLGVANIAYKELKFGTNARDTGNAFFAADTAVECALLYDKTGSSAFTPSGPNSIGCASQAIALVKSSGAASVLYWDFVLPGLGSFGGQACAKVKVKKDSSGPKALTTIISKGYNIGDSSCDSSNPDRVERELKVSY